MKITHTAFTLGDLTWTLMPHPDNETFLVLEGKKADGALVAMTQIATSTNGLATMDVRATTGNPLTVTVGGADGSLPYSGTA